MTKYQSEILTNISGLGGHKHQGSDSDISHLKVFLHGTHAGQCDHRVSDQTMIPLILYLCVSTVFNCWYLVNCYLQIRRHSESLSSLNLDAYVKSTEIHWYLARKRILLSIIIWLFSVVRWDWHTHLVTLHKDLDCEDAFPPYYRSFFFLVLKSGVQPVEEQ